jgi:hypothetical protein
VSFSGRTTPYSEIAISMTENMARIMDIVRCSHAA